MQSSPSARTFERARGPRRRWLTDAVIAGFVAIGASTGVLMVAYALADGAADSRGDILRRWLWQLTHNDVVAFSSSRPALAIALHVVLGLVWALVYARFVENNRSLGWWIGDGPGWSRGMRFALLPWLVSLLLLLPAAAINMLDWAQQREAVQAPSPPRLEVRPGIETALVDFSRQTRAERGCIEARHEPHRRRPAPNTGPQPLDPTADWRQGTDTGDDNPVAGSRRDQARSSA
jgi:hypothetical protein